MPTDIICSLCGSDKTLEQNVGNKKRPRWYLLDGEKICRKCYEKTNKKYINRKKTDKYKNIHKKACKKYSTDNPEKIKAHQIANRLDIRLDFCEKCGIKNVKLEGHHPDYSEPEKIVTLCVKCHQEVHSVQPA